MAKAKNAVPEGHHTVTPHLILDNAAQTIDWYKKALGAEEVARAVGPDGKSCTRKSASAIRSSC
jgi:PhnB protein